MSVCLQKSGKSFQVLIPEHRCHETHQPGHTADGGEGLRLDKLMTLWTLSPAGTRWKFVHIQNHLRSCEEEEEEKEM